MSSPKYFIIVDADDDNDMPTEPRPCLLAEVPAKIEQFLKRYEIQGYYCNCRQDRIPLGDVKFVLTRAIEIGNSDEAQDADDSPEEHPMSPKDWENFVRRAGEVNSDELLSFTEVQGDGVQIRVIETADKHELLSIKAPTLPEAIELAYQTMPQALASWGYAMPVES